MTPGFGDMIPMRFEGCKLDEGIDGHETCAACHGDGFVLASDVGESGSEFGDFEDGYITCPDCNGSGINE